MSVYDKFLTEMAIAKDGNYDFGNLYYIGNGERVLSDFFYKELKKVEYKGETYSIGKYKETKKPTYYLLTKRVYDEDSKKERNRVLVAMSLEFIQTPRGFNYKNIAIVRGVETDREMRGGGFATLLYKHLVNDIGITLMGDEEQYLGARNLWISLSNHPEFIVDIVDISNAKVIEKNVKLTDALDPRIWTDEKLMLTGTKEERKIGRFRRLVLTKVN